MPKTAKKTTNNTNLVIVESPAKAKTIEKYLGAGFVVKASKGHIVDLPKSGLGVDVDKGFEVSYEVMPGKQQTIKELKGLLVGKKRVLIAVDPDREGEAIGWHVANRLGLVDLKGKRKSPEIELQRISFTEITKTAIDDALKHPRELDRNLLLAQQTRRVLDRLVGYKLSPLLWKKIRFGLSAGRVQSVAARFVVDRELARQAFVPEEYWQIFAYLSKSGTTDKMAPKLIRSGEEIPTPPAGAIRFDLVKLDSKKSEFDSAKTPESILPELLMGKWVIEDKDFKTSKRYPKPPFTTSTLQQTAANWLGFSAKKTMTIAQKLYEQGFITYMRTDSVNMSESAIVEARNYIQKKYGPELLPSTANKYKTKDKVAQEAHEAIRPADFKVKSAELKLESDFIKLYELIFNRALASQCMPAEIESLAVSINRQTKKGLAEFRTNGQRVIFAGYLSVYPEKISETELPDLAVGEELNLRGLFSSQHFTQPPARFSEATLIKELEKYGIGRPSTYAPIISTIQQRGYVTKENSYFTPTDTGMVVTKLIKEHFSEIVDEKFTALMEDGLDDIANGEKDWQAYLHDFYDPFAQKLQTKETEISRQDFTVLGEAPADIICPDCKAKMLLKLGRYGRFYSCSRFPDCKGILTESGKSESDLADQAKSEEFLADYMPAPITEDGKEYLLKEGRFGQFWAHPDYPKVKDAKPLQYRRNKLIELFGDIPLTKDGRDFNLRNGRFGQFWAHPDYPEVKEIIRIKKKQS